MEQRFKVGDIVRFTERRALVMKNNPPMEILGAKDSAISILVKREGGFLYNLKSDYKKPEWDGYNVAYDKMIPGERYSWEAVSDLELVDDLERNLIQIQKEIHG